MADKVLEYRLGQFVSPNQDNNQRITPNQVPEATEDNIQSSALITFAMQQSKNLTSAVTTRIGTVTGNRSLGRDIQFASDLITDVTTIGAGFLAGGLPGAGLAAGSIVMQKGIQAFDITLERQRANIDAEEVRRRAGLFEIGKGEVFR